MTRRQRRRQPTLEEQVQGEKVPSVTLIFIGLLIGLAGALYYAWIINPVVFTDANPSRFSDQYRTDYVLMVSQSFATDGNVELARQRLQVLGDENENQLVSNLLERFVRERRPSAQIESLAYLAQNMGVEGATVALFAPTPISNAATTPTPIPSPTSFATIEPTATSQPSPTPFATIEPTATPEPTAVSQTNYRLLNQERVCDDSTPPRIEVITLDALLVPLAGVQVQVQWQDGSDQFVTGFQPDIALGYGDFTMSSNTSYTISMMDGSPEVSGLRIEPCDDGTAGSWRLTFQNLVVRQ